MTLKDSHSHSSPHDNPSHPPITLSNSSTMSTIIDLSWMGLGPLLPSLATLLLSSSSCKSLAASRLSLQHNISVPCFTKSILWKPHYTDPAPSLYYGSPITQILHQVYESPITQCTLNTVQCTLHLSLSPLPCPLTIIYLSPILPYSHL